MKKAQQYFLFYLKVCSALCFAYILTLIGQELIGFKLFSFVFLLLSISLASFYVIKPYNLLIIMIIDISFICLFVLLRFYILSAYGS